MKKDPGFVHPYMPNSVPAIKKAMLDEIGVESVEAIYKSLIPDDLLYKERLDLPEPIGSEYELKRHVMGILNKNVTTDEYISFLGAGCYRHQVPALCDEINSRGEFLTAYCGDTYSDHGKMQAIFEYCSMMGELLDAEVVSYTTYDASQSVASSLRMALRIKEAEGRSKDTLLIPSTMNPEIVSQVTQYVGRSIKIIKVECDKKSGLMDLADLSAKLKENKTAAVFYENPSYLGFFETQAEGIADRAHQYDALCVAQPETASLGIVESPLNLGADLVCGDIQPLGMHVQFGGGQAGFIACQQKQEYVEQFPTYMYGIAKTKQEGRFGWGRAMNYRCSHGSRENANEYFGTETGLWAITAAVYLASMGPKGMYELGESIVQKTKYAILELSEVQGLKGNLFGGANFQEFVVNFDETGKSVAEINGALLEKGIFGGKDLSGDFPQLGQSALYCISELTSEEDVQALKSALAEIARR